MELKIKEIRNRKMLEKLIDIILYYAKGLGEADIEKEGREVIGEMYIESLDYRRLKRDKVQFAIPLSKDKKKGFIPKQRDKKS